MTGFLKPFSHEGQTKSLDISDILAVGGYALHGALNPQLYAQLLNECYMYNTPICLVIKTNY